MLDAGETEGDDLGAKWAMFLLLISGYVGSNAHLNV
jgi:hypothetical protein